ncbi:MAG: hypothetical protein COB85_01280 [Bacteroidetes bacterium]|nr:MAG: hypothetical protein COB85_01280 [Bacteroidota bacterium]
MFNKKTLKIRLLLITIVLVLVNVAADRFWFRLDFTADQRYTLSNATLNILESIDQPVTVSAYFSEDLPPHIVDVRNDFMDLLMEYVKRSNGQIVYEFINPNESEETEQQAQQQGITPVMVNIRERDQVKQQRIYLGAIIQIGESKDIIPFIQPGAAMEYALSSTIKKLSVMDKPKIGIVQGIGGPSMQAIQQVLALLSVLYDAVPVDLSSGKPIPQHLKAIAIIAPRDTLGMQEFPLLENYINNGGNVLIAMNRVDGDLSQGMGAPIATGLESWLAAKGIIVDDNFLVDASCGAVSVRRQQGMFTFNQQIQFPYFPLITNFSDHVITKGIESVMLPFASGITYDESDTNLRVTVLATTSKKSGKVSSNVQFDVSKQWSENDFPIENQAVAILAEGPRIGNGNSKIVVFGDGDFAVNGEGRAAQQIQPDNANLLVNAIDFLSDDTGLNELRTKGVTSRPIDPDLEDDTKTMIKYTNFLLPIILIIVYGLARTQMRRRERLKWMEESYV